ncbi:YceI family protein [Parvularcula sp. LCG005]|uniref:YceI family protein n=1 Tax=Parvularcula sp. LCG005 TaxID=3078805 RepID=UPI00294308FF|nr:YceI family protein [Parvularcula sp. LCG005]WOI53094.1 YceI family protein [Parvularcula sp. LCG005]
MKTLLLAALASTSFTAAAFAADDHMEANGLAAIASGTYEIDKSHGYVNFTYNHMGLSNPILSFTDVDATVQLVADDPTKSTLMVDIDPSSVSTGVEVFNGHLTGEDWLNVAEYDDITFKSTSLTMTDAENGTLTGDLTLKGVTKPVTLDVTLNGAKKHPMKNIDAFGITATGTIMRSEFGLGAYVPAVSDEVELMISAEFLKAE